MPRASKRNVAGRRKPRHIEEQHLRAYFSKAQMLWIQGDDLEPDARLSDYAYHPPMGGKRDRFEAHNLRRQGAKAGVSDIHVPIARLDGNSLWIELKAEYRAIKADGLPGRLIRTKPTSEQVAWLERMSRGGHWTAMAWSWEAAIDLTMAYISGQRQRMVAVEQTGYATVCQPGGPETWRSSMS